MTVTESPPLSTCTVQIERRGGRGDAGARALERHLSDTPGVHDVDVSFRTGSARITYDESVTSEERLRDAVRDRDVSIQDESDTAPDEVTSRSELRREAAFVGLTLLGMVTGLATGWLDGPRVLTWAGYGVAYVFGGWYGLRGAIETLRHRAVDIDLLMIVAALGALSIGAPFEGAMLLFLFSLSNTLQHYAIGRSRRAIKSLVEMRPDDAQVLRDGEEVTVPVDEVAVGDRLAELAAVVVGLLAGEPGVPAHEVLEEDAPLVVAQRHADVAGRCLAGEAFDQFDDALVVGAAVDQVAVDDEDGLVVAGPVEAAVVVGVNEGVEIGGVADGGERRASGVEVAVDIADADDTGSFGVERADAVAGGRRL